MKYEFVTVVFAFLFSVSIWNAQCAEKPTNIQISSEQIEQILIRGYANLDSDAWKTPSETILNTQRDVATVKALLEGESDSRWASILLDSRVLAPTKSYSREVGAIWLLSGAAYPPFPSYGLEKEFEFFGEDEKTQRDLLGTAATLKTIRSAYGEPKSVKKTGKCEVHYYGFVGFRTNVGDDMITGLVMPFVLLKIGHKEFAKLVLDSGAKKPASKPEMPNRM